MSEGLLVWQCQDFAKLSVYELYAVMALRQQVFAVEQACAYLDADGYDIYGLHVMGWQGDNLAAYARILPPKSKHEYCSIGRVATASVFRGKGQGRILMQEAIKFARAHYDNVPITISAQEYLADGFYKSLGFSKCSETYMEDGIPHVEMRSEAV